MALHVPTLAIVAVFVTAILGVLLIFACRREQGTNALASWGVGYLLCAIGLGLLSARGAIPSAFSIEAANAINLLGYSFMLAGARSFGGREMPLAAYLLAPLVWLIAMRLPPFQADINLRVILVSGCQITFTALVAYEFWRGRAEPLLSRWPAIILLLTHAAILLARVPIVIARPLDSDMDFLRSAPFAVMIFGSVLYTISFAFLLLSLIKERGEFRHKTAALVDPLTGLANRRAFLHEAEAVAQRRAKAREPLSVLLADLDRFKAVNDAFGHAIGDRVLQVFADTIQRTLRAHDVSGRLGGEEFAFTLPGASAQDAAQVAERIRLRFADAALTIGEHAVASTVSIGVASTSAPMANVADLLAVADRALYRAKAEGRDRVVVIDCDRADEAPSIVPDATVVPIAARRATPHGGARARAGSSPR
jgi:diguanylate cyclase (GGDEF)-like protein